MLNDVREQSGIHYALIADSVVANSNFDEHFKAEVLRKFDQVIAMQTQFNNLFTKLIDLIKLKFDSM